MIEIQRYHHAYSTRAVIVQHYDGFPRRARGAFPKIMHEFVRNSSCGLLDNYKKGLSRKDPRDKKGP